MNPMFAGIIIGLLLGILLALGVAVWLNRNTGNAFVEKTKPVEALTPLPPVKAVPGSGATATASTPGDKPRFEFYEILPGDKNAAAKKPADTVVQPTVAPTPPVAAKTEEKSSRPELPKTAPVSAPAPATPESYVLQAGAFQNAADADNLKAKIAFAGFEATVKPVNVPDKGTLFRVRLGPYKGIDEVNRVKAALSQNGISASAIKAD
jgi:cell division protein FtsN